MPYRESFEPFRQRNLSPSAATRKRTPLSLPDSSTSGMRTTGRPSQVISLSPMSAGTRRKGPYRLHTPPTSDLLAVALLQAPQRPCALLLGAFPPVLRGIPSVLHGVAVVHAHGGRQHRPLPQVIEQIAQSEAERRHDHCGRAARMAGDQDPTLIAFSDRQGRCAVLVRRAAGHPAAWRICGAVRERRSRNPSR